MKLWKTVKKKFQRRGGANPSQLSSLSSADAGTANDGYRPTGTTAAAADTPAAANTG